MTDRCPSIPPHRAIHLSGLHAYADRLSVAAGESISFMVSSDVAYRMEVCRLGTAIDDPTQDRVLWSSEEPAPLKQPIHPGSYVHVANGLPPSAPIEALTVECWVRPMRLDRWAGLVTQYDDPEHRGYGLFLNPHGGVRFSLGTGGASESFWIDSAESLQIGRWHHVVGVWDGARRTLWIDGRAVASAPAPGAVIAAGSAPIRIGACGERGVADHFLEGDLAMPVLYGRALGDAEIQARHGDQARTPPALRGVLGCWPLAEERGASLLDLTGERHGQIINHATWMIGGPSFDTSIGKFTDPNRGHALKLAGSSHVHVERGLPPAQPIAAMTLECWVLPRRTDVWTCLLGQHDEPDHCGVGLFLEPEGRAALYVGDGGASRGSGLRSPPGVVQAGHWHHVVGVWDGSTRLLWINGALVAGPEPVAGPVAAGFAPLRLGASGCQGRVGRRLEGDLAMPVIYGRALSAAEIEARLRDGARTAPTRGVLACWPLAQPSGSAVPELTGARRGELLHDGQPLWLPTCPKGPDLGWSLKLDGGAYLEVPNQLAATTPITALTLECWVRPFTTNVWACLMGQHDDPDHCGIGLFLNREGGITFHLGDGKACNDFGLVSPRGATRYGLWHHVVGVWNGSRRSLWIDGALAAGPAPVSGPVAAGPAPLLIGACARRGTISEGLNGDIAMPAIYGRALRAAEIRARYRDGGQSPPAARGLLGCWPLSEGAGTVAADVTGARPARIHPRSPGGRPASWIVASPCFDGFVDYRPGADPNRGHALRFASDDLYDCRWTARHAFSVPPDAAPGLYAARFRCTIAGETRLYHVTFVVKRAPSAQRAPILILAATNTWRAYSATPFVGPLPGLKQVWGTDGAVGVPPPPAGVPVYSLYRGHDTAARQPTYQVGLRMPSPASSPYALYSALTDYSHTVRLERFTHAWLERSGYAYDMVSDLDLHREPGLLQGYRVVLIAGHSEYWSIPMYEGLKRYLDAGGNVISLSGNSLWWRVSFDDEEGVMECRKVGEGLAGFGGEERRGETWHSQDWKRGGMLRECGYPGMSLLGLDYLGYIDHNDEKAFGGYVVALSSHPFFTTPRPTGLSDSALLACAPGGGLPRANGHEVDVTYATHTALQKMPAPLGMPVAGAEPATAYQGVVLLASAAVPLVMGLDLYGRPLLGVNKGGELIYWERPSGGRVLNAGSIGAGWPLGADPAYETFLRNVLSHFGV